MKNTKDIIKDIIIFLLLIILTFYIIYSKQDINHTIDIITSINPIYIILGVFTMLIYFILGSINICNILKELGNKITIMKCLKYTLIGFFFSGITPAASGGQPMQIYTMHKEKIPISHATIALIIELASFQAINITCGVSGAIINQELLTTKCLYIFIIGLTLSCIALSVLIIGLFLPNLGKRIVNKLFSIFNKKSHTKKQKLEKILDNYQKSSQFIKSNKIILVKSLILVFFQMIAYYSVAYIIYRAFGLSEYNFFKIITIQSMLFISVSSIPLPGAIGVSEGTALKLYQDIFGIIKYTSAVLVMRFINFYIYILIGLIVFICNTQKKKS